MRDTTQLTGWTAHGRRRGQRSVPSVDVNDVVGDNVVG